MIDTQAIRKCFPILSRKVNGKPLVYLDSASTSQKPDIVIDTVSDFYRNSCGNVHRGVHALTRETTELYEDARRTVARFIGAADPAEIIFTRNATEAIHMVAWSWAREHVGEGDEIVISEMEHHSNLVPWQILAKERGANLRFLGIGMDDTLEPGDLESLITPRTKLITVVHVSNTLGVINPVHEIIRIAARNGVPVFLDAAQSVPHLPVNVAELGCDFLAFSGHKMLGPAGIGVLWVSKNRQREMKPFLTGGGAIDQVGRDGATFNEAPYKFEAGTPAVADALGLAAAIDFLDEIGMENVRAHEEELTARALSSMSRIDGLSYYGPEQTALRSGVISFNVKGIEPYELGSYLDSHGVAIRAGDHCTQPLLRALGISSTARVSFYLYNTINEIDFFTGLVEKAAEDGI